MRHLAQAGRGHHLSIVISGYLKVINALPQPPNIIFCVIWFIQNRAFLRSRNNYVTWGVVPQCQSMLALTVDCSLAVKYVISAWCVSSSTCYINPLRVILILIWWTFSDNEKSGKKCWFTLVSPFPKRTFWLECCESETCYVTTE
jgi:hypothetical protein